MLILLQLSQLFHKLNFPRHSQELYPSKDQAKTDSATQE